MKKILLSPGENIHAFSPPTAMTVMSSCPLEALIYLALSTVTYLFPVSEEKLTCMLPVC